MLNEARKTINAHTRLAFESYIVEDTEPCNFLLELKKERRYETQGNCELNVMIKVHVLKYALKHWFFDPLEHFHCCGDSNPKIPFCYFITVIELLL